jgi:hypothetical protein
MTPLRRLAQRAPPLLHAALVGGFCAVAIVAVKLLTHGHVSEAVVAIVTSVAVAAGSRGIGWAVHRSFRTPTDASLVLGRVDLEQLHGTLAELIHGFVNDLSAMQGDVQLMLMKLDRFRAALTRLAQERGE